MTLNLMMSEGDHEELRPRITVFGVGGAGGNAVNNMIDKQLEGVEFVVANTDAQALAQSKSRARVQIGGKVTEGLGAGARPSVGAAAAEESIEQIVDHLAGSHMCFITAGMGGGTGTGAAPIIAQAARELGVLTVGVVTKPFQFEGAKRMRQAEAGVEALQKVVDTLIIIPNQNLFRLANEKTTFTEAFAMADDVLYQGVKGISDLMVRPGLINLDFADVRSVMDEMGKAMMGTGEADGEDRARHAAEKAIANPLLDEISLNGAKGVLINITGGYDLTLFELDEAANVIREKVDPEANIIVGSTLDPELEGVMRVSVVATGIDASASAGADMPGPRRAGARPAQQVAAQPSQPAPQAPVMPAAQPAPQALAPQPAPAPRAPDAGYAQEGQGSFGFAPQQGYDEPHNEAVGADDLPPPVYRPQPQAQPQAAVRREPSYQDDSAEWVAPRPRTPGQPSPEALARLSAAVAKSPAPGQGAPRGPVQRPVQQERIVERAQPAEKPRFGINSLINRMTGGAGHEQPMHHPERPAPAMRSTAAPAARPAAYDDEQEGEAEQDRIEIPAFLRRQAN